MKRQAVAKRIAALKAEVARLPKPLGYVNPQQRRFLDLLAGDPVHESLIEPTFCRIQVRIHQRTGLSLRALSEAGDLLDTARLFVWMERTLEGQATREALDYVESYLDEKWREAT